MIRGRHNTYLQPIQSFPREQPSYTDRLLREMLGLIRKENYFQFNGRNYLQSHVAAMGIKMAVAFANIFMCTVENYFEPKQHQITRVETVHRRRILFMGH